MWLLLIPNHDVIQNIFLKMSLVIREVRLNKVIGCQAKRAIDILNVYAK